MWYCAHSCCPYWRFVMILQLHILIWFSVVNSVFFIEYCSLPFQLSFGTLLQLNIRYIWRLMMKICSIQALFIMPEKCHHHKTIWTNLARWLKNGTLESSVNCQIHIHSETFSFDIFNCKITMYSYRCAYTNRFL